MLLLLLLLLLLSLLLTRKSMQSRGRTPEELSTIATELAKKKFELDTKLIIDIEARRKVSEAQRLPNHPQSLDPTLSLSN